MKRYMLLMFILLVLSGCDRTISPEKITFEETHIYGTLETSEDYNTFILLSESSADGYIIVKSIDMAVRLDLNVDGNSASLNPNDSRWFPVISGNLVELRVTSQYNNIEYELSWVFIPYEYYSNNDINEMLVIEIGHNVVGIGNPNYESYVKFNIENAGNYSINTIFYASYNLSVLGGLESKLYSETGEMISTIDRSSFNFYFETGTYYLHFKVPHDTEGIITFDFEEAS